MSGRADTRLAQPRETPSTIDGIRFAILAVMRILVGIFLLTACGTSPGQASAPDGALPDGAGAGSGSGISRIGTFVQSAYTAPPVLPYTGAEGTPPAIDDSTRNAITKALGGTIERTPIRFLGPGMSTGTAVATALEQAGLQLALTTLASPANSDGSTPPLDPSEVAAFQANLDATLTALSPAVVMVENEEIAPNFFSGTPADYQRELAAAVETAHAHHIPVTNGGLTNVPCRLLTWYAYYRQADFARADAFADETFAANWRQLFPSASDPTHMIAAHTQAQIDKGLELVAIYRASAMDYVNIHIYELGADAMTQIVDYVANAVGKPVMTGEMGQYDELGATVDTMLGVAVAKQFPFVIWYSGDGNPAVALVSSSVSAPGYTMRSSGLAFRAFTDAHAP